MMGNQFTGLIAAILGGVSFGGGSGHMAGVFIGILLLNTFSMGTIIVRLNTHLRFVFEGTLLLLALGLDYYHVRKKQKELMKVA
jgi:ribose/xylose/arabinose/galactoside ABC-type transport system permease subunit